MAFDFCMLLPQRNVIQLYDLVYYQLFLFSEEFSGGEIIVFVLETQCSHYIFNTVLQSAIEQLGYGAI